MSGKIPSIIFPRQYCPMQLWEYCRQAPMTFRATTAIFWRQKVPPQRWWPRFVLYQPPPPPLTANPHLNHTVFVFGNNSQYSLIAYRLFDLPNLLIVIEDFYIFYWNAFCVQIDHLSGWTCLIKILFICKINVQQASLRNHTYLPSN